MGILEKVASLKRQQRRIRELRRPSTDALPSVGALMDWPAQLDPQLVAPTHLAPFVDALERAPHGRLRLTCSVPPRHFKTVTAAAAVAWWLRRDPTLRIMYVSYGARLAQDKSRLMRSFAREAGVELSEDVRAKHHWLTPQGGGVIASGIGGDITGHGCDILLVDDPVKNRAEAESSTIRERTWDWYTSTALTRLEPDGSAIIIQTRWHEDDLAGRAGQEGYECINLPAWDERGYPLAPDRFSRDDLERVKREVGAYDWESLYMGRPRPRGGKLFADVITTDESPGEGTYAIGVDLAQTARTSSDWSVAVVMCRDRGGRITIVDVERAQERLSDVTRDGEVVATGFNRRIARMQSCYPGARTLWLIGGKEDVVAELMGELGSCPVAIEVEPAVNDKWIRAGSYAARWNEGGVCVLRAPWTDIFVKEHVSFTGLDGGRDDQVDAAVAAYAALAGNQVPNLMLGGKRRSASLRERYT